MKTNLHKFKLCFLSTCLLPIFLQAQDVTEAPAKKIKVDFQIRGGLNISNLTEYYDGESAKADAKVGFNIGGVADFTLSEKVNYDWTLMTGLFLSSKGANINNMLVYDGNDYAYIDIKSNAMYLQIPVYVGFKTALPKNPKNKIGVYLGPYFAYGIAGKTEFGQRGQRTAISIDTFDKDSFWNRPDIGLGMELTLELDRLVFLLGGEVGMARAWKSSALDRDSSVRNNVSYLSVGYKF